MVFPCFTLSNLITASHVCSVQSQYCILSNTMLSNMNQLQTCRCLICIQSQMWRCKSDYCSAIASCKGYVDITSGSEEGLLDALVNVGPVRYIYCMHADVYSWTSYFDCYVTLLCLTHKIPSFTHTQCGHRCF